jgi:hypothetical protein
MTGSSLALRVDAADIERAADPGVYVLEACERAKTWLTHALEHGDIDQIVELKSQAEAIRIYTMSKQLGKDAELSAIEIVRRAERGLGMAIRKGQQAGLITSKGTATGPKSDYVRAGKVVHVDGGRTLTSISPGQFFQDPTDRACTYAVTDNITDDLFEAAIAEAKAEGNLSRANVVRKVRAKREAQEVKAAAMADPDPGTEPDSSATEEPKRPAKAAERYARIRELAASGHTSVQIAEIVGYAGADSVRQTARDQGITIPADAVMARVRKTIDSNRVVRETVFALEDLVSGLVLVTFDDLDVSQIGHWTDSLNDSISALRKLIRNMKEKAQ